MKDKIVFVEEYAVIEVEIEFPMPYRLSGTFIYGFIRQSLDVYRHVYCGGSCNVVIIWHIDESVPEIALLFEAMLVHCFLLFGTFNRIAIL